MLIFSASCTTSWSSPFNDTNVLGGTLNSARTLTDCQSACAASVNCSGIDWNPSNPDGICFLAFPNVTSGKHSQPNVTHYDYLGSNCNGEFTLSCNTYFTFIY